MSDKSIALKDIGPIENLSIPVPEGGGVVVLRGRNGAGKTRALDAVDKLTAGQGRVDKRDGVVTPGTIEGFGAVIKVASRTSHAGDLDVVRLEDQNCVADLVDPNMKDAGAADRHRLKALLRITRAELDVSQFYDLLGGKDQFHATVKPSSLDGGDAVDTASNIKRDLEAAAREAERERDAKSERAAALAAAIEDVDLSGESDADKLRQAYQSATNHHEQIRAQRDAAQKSAKRQADAKQQVEKVDGEYDGPNPDKARAEADALVAQLEEMNARLSNLIDERDVVAIKAKAAEAAADAAEAHEHQVLQLKAIINAPTPEAPTDDEIEAAQQAAQHAAQAMERGGVVRDALLRKEQHDDYRIGAEAAGKRAAEYRGAAASVDAVLSGMVRDQHVRVSDGRLVVTKADGREAFFHDLSEGERWTIALDIAVEAIGERGVMVIPQDAWQDLDPPNRKLIADHAHKRNVTIITAEAADGTLRAEHYEPPAN